MTTVDERLQAARRWASQGRLDAARLELEAVLKDEPGHESARRGAAQFALALGDGRGAAAHWQHLVAVRPEDPALRYQWAQALERVGQAPAAQSVLAEFLQQHPQWPELWLYRAHLHEQMGQVDDQLKALHQALTRAHKVGQWLDDGTTPPQLRATIQAARAAWTRRRKAHLEAAYEDLLAQHGPDALRRVQHALAVYLKEVTDAPPDPRQRPKFLYFPGLDTPLHPGPYHDPMRHPWAAALQGHGAAIRAEAEAWLRDPQGKEGFLTFRPGDNADDYLGGTGAERAWDALFFYRHGQRLDAAHARCPQTSAALEAVDLCRIPGQTPEICFSVLEPGTMIKPHYGVTNTRLVMHLPLIVPPDCALQVLGSEPHAWQEGRLFMFDDTYEHQAWNRSDRVRVILLMDCWHPSLTEVERLALTALVQRIAAFETLG